jgi:membrane-bound hydrogenase subunit mbhJ
MVMAGKIAVYRFMSGGCNGCDVEILECLVPRYKLAELGVAVVFTPEEANVLALTGGVTIKGKEELLKAYEKIQPPKLVVAIGNCAVSKDIFAKGYPMVGPPDQLVPVNYYIHGCPPRPQAIVTAIAKALGVTLPEKESYWAAPEGFRGKHEISKEKCIGCGACAQVCSSDAIDVLEGDGKRLIKVNYGLCTFCAFCQDECPTEAIKLTKEYHLLTDNRNTANVTNEVSLVDCAACKANFMPTSQVDWAADRVIEKVPAYKEFKDTLKNSMEICYDCRKEMGNIKNAKKLLAQLSAKAREA